MGWAVTNNNDKPGYSLVVVQQTAQISLLHEKKFLYESNLALIARFPNFLSSVCISLIQDQEWSLIQYHKIANITSHLKYLS